jgi:hypothetical protein
MALPPHSISNLNDHFGQYVICVRWNACRGVNASELKRVKDPESENGKLTKRSSRSTLNPSPAIAGRCESPE